MQRFLFSLILMFAASTSVGAANWRPALAARTNMPPLFMAVDKSKQRAFLVRASGNATALDKFQTLTCTTGQRDGDKQVEGDLKTPEGVYFVTGKITSGLDYTLYGNNAFPLNFPNPVDRIRGKTGYGIWIHGRGTPVTPKQTRGCVSLNNADVDHLDDHVARHATPVIIGQNIAWANATTAGAPRDVISGTWAWGATRERRDERFFDLYDPKLFAKSSGKSFARFQDETRAEFSAKPWIDVRLGKIQVLEGPDYVVSFFTEQILSHDSAKEGWRRLYWMRQGENWKIVGEEWVPQAARASATYPRVVEKEILSVLRHGEEAWSRRSLDDLIKLYARDAKRGLDAGDAAIERRVRADLDAGMGNPFSGTPQIALTDQGVVVLLSQAGSGRRFVFQPAKFDTWAITAEDPLH